MEKWKVPALQHRLFFLPVSFFKMYYSFFEGHDIISTDIISAPIRCPTKEDFFPGELCASPGGKAHKCAWHVGTTWHNIDRYYISANSLSEEGGLFPWRIVRIPRREIMSAKAG